MNSIESPKSKEGRINSNKSSKNISKISNKNEDAIQKISTNEKLEKKISDKEFE